MWIPVKQIWEFLFQALLNQLLIPSLQRIYFFNHREFKMPFPVHREYIFFISKLRGIHDYDVCWITKRSRMLTQYPRMRTHISRNDNIGQRLNLEIVQLGSWNARIVQLHVIFSNIAGIYWNICPYCTIISGYFRVGSIHIFWSPDTPFNTLVAPHPQQGTILRSGECLPKRIISPNVEKTFCSQNVISWLGEFPQIEVIYPDWVNVVLSVSCFSQSGEYLILIITQGHNVSHFHSVMPHIFIDSK